MILSGHKIYKWEDLVSAIMLRVIFLEKVFYLLAYFDLPVLRNLPYEDSELIRTPFLSSKKAKS